jgi:hypothetical protein
MSWPFDLMQGARKMVVISVSEEEIVVHLV